LAYRRQRKANDLALNFGDQQKHELDKLLNHEVFLKRNKEDVLADVLPMKLNSVVFCELSDIQLCIYKHVLGLPDYDIIIKSNAPCDCGVNRQVGSIC
jgi:SNF2 family DNA or RNA helicase